MRHATWILAAVAIMALATTTAQAGNSYRGGNRGYGAIYGSHHGSQCNIHSGYGRGYGGNRGYGSYRLDPHTASVRRIMANHSRDRYNPHPRSMYKGPAVYPNYRGW